MCKASGEIKVYDFANRLKYHTDEDYLSRLNGALSTIRGVNRTDAPTLCGTFKTAARIMQAYKKDLAGRELGLLRLVFLSSPKFDPCNLYSRCWMAFTDT